MKQKKGLGKGLDALLGGDFSQNRDDRIVNIDIDLLDANIDQPRKEFNPERIEELSESIKRYGVIQPIIVVKNGERYLIVAGERRFRAAKLAELSTMPAIIRDTDEEEILEVALIENIQRENLNPIEEAEALRFLMQRHRLTQDELAKRIGKSRSLVANSVRLLTLPEEARTLVAIGALSAGHAKVLLGVKDASDCISLAQAVVDEKLSVRELEARLRPTQPAPAAPEPAPRDVLPQKTTLRRSSDRRQKPELLEAVDNMRRVLDTKVTILGNDEKGKIEIEYYSKENLEAIYNKIMGDGDPDRI